jgi:diguanylate cyclase (GGDEF)-like protein
MHARLAAERRRRGEAEREAAASHRELNDSIEQLTRVSRAMQRLSAYASLLQSCQDREEALDITKISLSALLPDCAGTVYLLGEQPEDEDGIGSARAMIGWGEHRLRSREHLKTADCWAMRRVQPFATDASNAELRCAHIEGGEGGADSTLCLPLNAQGESLGLLYLSGATLARDHGLAETAAEQLSMALANLRLKETLHNQSIRDALTGLYNRRFLEDSLSRELARAGRQQRPLAVLMFDVDHFKRFNDSHGHPGGDALLSAVGKLLRQECRAADIPCRYGGEEFTVIMPETDAAAAQVQAERIRHAVAALAVRHEGRPLSAVTASLGIAVFPQHASLQDALLDAADEALYRAKAGGRNQVQLAAGG